MTGYTFLICFAGLFVLIPLRKVHALFDYSTYLLIVYLRVDLIVFYITKVKWDLAKWGMSQTYWKSFVFLSIQPLQGLDYYCINIVSLVITDSFII